MKPPARPPTSTAGETANAKPLERPARAHPARRAERLHGPGTRPSGPLWPRITMVMKSVTTVMKSVCACCVAERSRTEDPAVGPGRAVDRRATRRRRSSPWRGRGGGTASGNKTSKAMKQMQSSLWRGRGGGTASGNKTSKAIKQIQSSLWRGGGGGTASSRGK